MRLHPLCVYALAMAAVFLAVIPLSFVGMELGAVRNYQTVLSILVFPALLWHRRARSEDRVPAWAIGVLAASAGVSLLVNQLLKFNAFYTSGSDFPIFDRMLYETNHGRFMYAPTAGINHLGIHPTYVMVPLALLHRVFEGPLLLVVVTWVVVWIGVVPLWLLVRHAWSEDAALLAAVAYLTNPWLMGALDGGFHPEVFYPATGLFFLLGWVQERPAIWAPAAAVFLAIKEDAALIMLGFAVAAVVFEPRRLRAGLSIAASSAALLAVNLGVVQPFLLQDAPGDHAAYGRFWGQYGGSFGQVVQGMISSPLRVAADLARSAWYRLFGAALFLPLLSRALLPMLPTLLLLGTSSNPVMWKYGWYYPLALIPFVFWGLIEARRSLPILRERPQLREGVFLAALLVFPLVGAGYMRFPIPSLDQLRAIPALQARLLETPEVCAQEAIVPRVPYQVSVHALTAQCLRRPGAIVVVNPGLDPYPYWEEQIREWIEEGRARGEVEDLGGGFYVLEGLRPESVRMP
ncbi:MAG TPA: DUF2079 domain-containing protein [Myxococcaceae bacterium]|jgi:uncharacterized membrane protein